MSKRTDRVAAQISRVISSVLLRGLRDKRVKPVSITAVTCSPDLRHARIFVVPLGGQGNPQRILEGLNHASGFINHQIAKELSMKYTPKVQFFLDEHFFESVAMIEKLEQQEHVRDDSEEEYEEDEEDEEDEEYEEYSDVSDDSSEEYSIDE